MKSSIEILTIFWFSLFHFGSQFFWFTSSAASKILSIPAASITLVIWLGISKLSLLSPSSSSSAEDISSKSFYFSFFIFPYKSIHIFRASWMPAAFSFSEFMSPTFVPPLGWKVVFIARRLFRRPIFNSCFLWAPFWPSFFTFCYSFERSELSVSSRDMPSGTDSVFEEEGVGLFGDVGASSSSLLDRRG